MHALIFYLGVTGYFFRPMTSGFLLEIRKCVLWRIRCWLSTAWVCIVVVVNHTCASDQFTCGNGRCIPQSWVCDAENDCGDRSDERSCPPHSCLPTEFTCQSPAGACIPQRFRCDHQHDCSDGSDEIDCRTSVCSHSVHLCLTQFIVSSFFKAADLSIKFESKLSVLAIFIRQSY